MLTNGFLLPVAELSIRPDLMSQLVPKHCEADLLAQGIDVNSFVPIPLADMRITLDSSLIELGEE